MQKCCKAGHFRNAISKLLFYGRLTVVCIALVGVWEETIVAVPPWIPCAAAEVVKSEDPFAKKLKIVEQYERNLPTDTIGSQKTTSSVKAYQGMPTLHINGKPVFPMAMIAIGHYPTQVCRDFAAAGIQLYSHIIWSSGSVLKKPDWWLGPGKYDFAEIDRQILSIIKADPQAYVFLRVKLNPPAWWLKAHPDEMTHYEDGRRGPQCSMASEVWEKTYERMLRDLIRHVEGSAYAGHIIGYQPAGGSASEWFWWGYRKGLIDYGPAARKRFQKWLKDRYHGDPGLLRSAWNDPEVTFQTAAPPSGQARKQAEYGIFRDPKKAGNVMDYQRFLSEVTAHNVIQSCRICKEETRGSKMVGVFYGYSLFTCLGPNELWNCGYLGLEKVLHSPYVDFFASPTDYNRRVAGDPGNFISAYTASYLLHGKLYWDEADYRTHLSSTGESWVTHSLPETLSVFERGFAYMLTKGTALWWFTLAGDHTFHQDEMMEDIAKMREIGQDNVDVSKEHLHEIAVLADEESYFRMRMGVSALTRPLMRDMQLKLATMGAPYDMYLLSDIADRRMPDYKVYIFLNAFYVDDATREAIKQKVRRNGALSVWFYAPGFIQPDGSFCEKAMHDLTGIRIRHKLEERSLQLNVTERSHPITEKVQQSLALEPTQELEPIFWADDPQATVLGRLGPEGEPGLVTRDFGTWRCVYCAAPGISNELLRGLIHYAGGHVYSTSNDTFYANHNYLMIHTATGGRKRITLPERRDVHELLEGKILGRNLATIDVTLPKAVTRVYRLRKPGDPSVGAAGNSQ